MEHYEAYQKSIDAGIYFADSSIQHYTNLLPNVGRKQVLLKAICRELKEPFELSTFEEALSYTLGVLRAILTDALENQLNQDDITDMLVTAALTFNNNWRQQYPGKNSQAQQKYAQAFINQQLQDFCEEQNITILNNFLTL